jgi:hypothetical protein
MATVTVTSPPARRRIKFIAAALLFLSATAVVAFLYLRHEYPTQNEVSESILKRIPSGHDRFYIKEYNRSSGAVIYTVNYGGAEYVVYRIQGGKEYQSVNVRVYRGETEMALFMFSDGKMKHEPRGSPEAVSRHEKMAEMLEKASREAY